MGCGAETEANTLMESLIDGLDFTIPEVDFSDIDLDIPTTAINPLTNAELTSGTIDGNGTFDVIMRAMSAHLQQEFDKNRITGDQFSKAYVALAAGSLANAVQFLLSRDDQYWKSQTARAEAITAQVKLETAKVELQAKRAEALMNQAGYALTKMKLSNESMSYCVAKYNLENILPAQKALLEQQKTSYKRDAEIKAAKVWADTWITQKTIDEGLSAPSIFTNDVLDDVFGSLKENLLLDGFGHP
jgi:hypothetical protein